MFFGDWLSLILLIVLIVNRSRINKRLKLLEGEVFLKTRPTGQNLAPSPASPVVADDFLSRPTTPTASSLHEGAVGLSRRDIAERQESHGFVAWLKEDWMLKVGGGLILIGFGWFVTYAIIQGWIGPAGRIALGIIAGTLMLILGKWRIRKYVQQGGVFLVLGSTIILLTIFAAREIYHFFTPTSALLIMFVSVSFIALSSIVHGRLPLALASIILAGVVPLLTGATSTNYFGLFSYLLIVVLGTLWIVTVTGWRALVLASLFVVSFYSLPHLAGIVESMQSEALLLFAFIFATIFFLTNTASILKLRGKDIAPDTIVAGGTGLFLIAWIMTTISAEWQSLMLAAWMIVFTGGAYVIFALTKQRGPFYVYAGVALGVLVAATAAELSGPTLTLAYIVESVLVILISHAILKDVRITQGMSWLLAGPIVLSLPSLTTHNWANKILHDDFFVLFTMAAALFILGAFFFAIRNRGALEEIRKFYSTFFTIGSVYALSLWWLSLHAGLESRDLATMISLATFTLVGLTTYISGRLRERKGRRVYGGVLIGVVVGRLLLVEVWDMALAGRIITFFIIGALLMSTAFIGRKPKEITHNQSPQ